MARKRVEDTVPALESWDDVNQALATIADNQRTVENFEAAMQNKIDEAKAEAEARSRVFIEAMKAMLAGGRGERKGGHDGEVDGPADH